MPRGPLVLDPGDPRVGAALEAEARLYRDYGLAPEHRYVALGATGMRVRVSIVGSGPPLVIVPGNTGDVFPLIPLMAAWPGRRLIAINRPGGGLSDGMDHRTVDIRVFAVETLATVMEALDLRAADIVAHSIGAHWSLWLAMGRPDLVGRLATLGNPGNVLSGGAPLALRIITRPPFSWLLGRFLAPRGGGNNLRMLRMMGHDPKVLEKLPVSFGACYGAFRRLPYYTLSLISLLRNGAPAITAGDLGRITQPVSLIWGTKDSFAGTDVGRAIAAALPCGTLHEIDGAGHLPWLEQASACADIISHFER